MVAIKATCDVSDAVKRLAGLPKTIQNRAMARGLRMASQLMAKALKPLIVKTPWSTGLMRKNITYKVGKARGTRRAAVVGARNVKVNGKNPSKYFHLVEGGTRARKITANGRKAMKFRPRTAMGKRLMRSARFASVIHHPGSRANRRMQAAVASSGLAASMAFARGIEMELHRAVARGKLGAE